MVQILGARQQQIYPKKKKTSLVVNGPASNGADTGSTSYKFSPKKN
jgi:hypothetical protein